MMSNETPKQRTERIFKEDKDKWEEEQIKRLPERRLQRIAVIERHRAILDASIQGKQKGIRFRKHFHSYVTTIAYKIFQTGYEEYQAVGKPGRLRYTDHREILKVYKKGDPMFDIIGEILTEFGCFEY